MYAIVTDTTSCTSFPIGSDGVLLGKSEHLPTNHFMCDGSSSGSHTSGRKSPSKEEIPKGKETKGSNVLDILLIISCAFTIISLLIICLVKVFRKDRRYIGLEDQDGVELHGVFSADVNEFRREPFRDDPVAEV